MALDNWVKLELGTRKTLHFRDHRVTEREITDPFWKTPRVVTSLLFLVDREDGVTVDKTLSITSERLASEFEPYLADRSYTLYEWVLAKGMRKMDPPRIAERRPL